MQYQQICDIPGVEEVTLYVIVASIDPNGSSEDRIFLVCKSGDEPSALGNPSVNVEPKSEIGDPFIHAPLSQLMTPVAENIVVGLASYIVGQMIDPAEEPAAVLRIDFSEVVCLMVPSGGKRDGRTFHLKMACVLPVAFLPFCLSSVMMADNNLPWTMVKDVLDGKVRLEGGVDEEYLVKRALEAYLSG